MKHDEELLKNLPVFLCNMEDPDQKVDVDKLIDLVKSTMESKEGKTDYEDRAKLLDMLVEESQKMGLYDENV